MAEQQQVELDTDGFQEQEVQVAESKSQEDTEPKVESVDLGYTDPIKADEKAEVVKTETKQDDLQEYSQGVQKRINQLTRKLREAERKEKAALDYAKGVQSKYSKTIILGSRERKSKSTKITVRRRSSTRKNGSRTRTSYASTSTTSC